MSAYEVRECPERSTRTCSAAAEDHRMPVPNGTPLHSNSYGLRSVSSLFIVCEDNPWLGVIDLSFTPLHSSGSTFTKKIHVVAKTRVLSNFTLKVSFFFIEMCLGVRSLKNNEYLPGSPLRCCETKRVCRSAYGRIRYRRPKDPGFYDTI